MRSQLIKLQRGKSTKAERVFAEILKSLRIPFLTKVIIDGKEIDFLFGKYGVEISGHEQNPTKNSDLLLRGVVPIHYLNGTIVHDRETVKQEIKHLWHEFETQN